VGKGLDGEGQGWRRGRWGNGVVEELRRRERKMAAREWRVAGKRQGTQDRIALQTSGRKPARTSLPK
jgi:hypothetical protein